FTIMGADLYKQISIPLEKIYSNHEAEFIAVIKGLEYLVQSNLSISFLTVYSDSTLVISAITKRYVKNTAFKPLLQKVQQLLKNFPFYSVEWVPESKNKGADNLARQALRKAIQQKTAKKNT
ncbi:MAG: ribonuclease HI family protein, partial [Pisciglobus halotolerans]|nr:ribonuclease HI family protein [Pisciglobus halotolerans]